jgi:chromate transporter
MSALIEDRAETPRVSLLKMFVSFLRVGLTSFGGGTSGWMHREVVERHRWLDDDQFLASLTVAQVLPGANPVNMAVYLGLQLRGFRGAIVAAVGMVLPAFCMILILGSLYTALSAFPLTSKVLGGIAMVGVASTLVMGLKTARKLPRRAVSFVIAGAIFLAIGILHWPLVPVVVASVPASILLSFYTDRSRARRG